MGNSVYNNLLDRVERDFIGVFLTYVELVYIIFLSIFWILAVVIFCNIFLECDFSIAAQIID